MNFFSALKIDWKLLLPVLVLFFVSLTTLFSINGGFFRSQLLFSILAIIVYVICSQLDYHALSRYGLPIYLIALILLALVLVLGIESRGAIRWLAVFGLRVQFSEIFKPLLAISLASFLSFRKSTSSGTLLLCLALLFPIAFLIYRQPDLGDALIYSATVLLTLTFFGFSLKWFGAGLLLVGGCIPILWRFLHQYQRERLLTFFHFANDPLGISYNAIQSVIAVGSGMFLGKGLGQGTQSGLRFLPERHTDFIFATLSEELGFVGSAIVIIAFCFLFYRIYTIFKESDDVFAKVFVAASFSLLLLQFFINIGMNIGLLPIVGVTLPFVSYGGSSLISNAIFLGIISAIGNKDHRQHVLEIT